MGLLGDARVASRVRVAVSYTLGPLGLRGLAAASVGLVMALAVLMAELRLQQAASSGLLGGAIGAVLGVFAALLVTIGDLAHG